MNQGEIVRRISLLSRLEEFARYWHLAGDVNSWVKSNQLRFQPLANESGSARRSRAPEPSPPCEVLHGAEAQMEIPKLPQFGIGGPCYQHGTQGGFRGSLLAEERPLMLVMKERQPATRTIEGWATSILLQAGAIRECEEHGWMKDRTDPHARLRAIEIASEEPPPGLSQNQAVRAVEEVLNSIGDTCPDCPPAGD